MNECLGMEGVAITSNLLRVLLRTQRKTDGVETAFTPHFYPTRIPRPPVVCVTAPANT